MFLKVHEWIHEWNQIIFAFQERCLCCCWRPTLPSSPCSALTTTPTSIQKTKRGQFTVISVSNPGSGSRPFSEVVITGNHLFTGQRASNTYIVGRIQQPCSPVFGIRIDLPLDPLRIVITKPDRDAFKLPKIDTFLCCVSLSYWCRSGSGSEFLFWWRSGSGSYPKLDTKITKKFWL